MDDAQTLGDGRWKVEVQASLQHNKVRGKDLAEDEIWALLRKHPQVNILQEVLVAYGVTDRFDLGVFANFYTVGMTGKYRLLQSPAGHAFSVGGRLLGGSNIYQDPVVSLQSYAFYTHRFPWGGLTLLPGWSFFYIGREERYLIFGSASLGIHLSIPLNQRITL